MSVYGLWTGQSIGFHDINTNDDWWLDGDASAPPNLSLWGVTLNTVNVDNWWSGAINVWGISTITNGFHIGAFSGFSISQQRVGSLYVGSSSVGYGAHFKITGGGPYLELFLNGLLVLNNANSVLDTDILGTGNIVLFGSGGTTELGGAVGSGDTIWCLEGRLQIDKPQLIQGTIEGLGKDIELLNTDGLLHPKLTATDFTAEMTRIASDGTLLDAGPLDLHIRDTPLHEVVWEHLPPSDGYAGRVALASAVSPVGALPQYVVHQT